MPAEVILSILEAIAHENDAVVKQKTLAAAALVCKDWTAPSQKLLFRRVTLESAPALAGFVSAISHDTPRARMLASTVASLRCVLDTKQPNGISQRAFADTVLRCPNLSELSLAVYGDDAAAASRDARQRAKGSSWQFDDAALALLQTGPRVSALRFDNWTDNACALAQLLEVFPCIDALAISGTTPALCAPVPTPFPCTLRELRTNLRSAPSGEFVNWLLENAALRTLEFTRAPEPELLADLLVAHASTLESLSVPSCASAECAAALASCTRLRSLRLENLWAASTASRSLPSTLRTLAFTVDKDTMLQPVLRALKDDTALEHIAVHAWADGARHAELPSLKMACALQGVELALVGDVRAFREMPLAH